MAIWRDAFVQITPGDTGGTAKEVSDACRSVELRLSRAEVDATTVKDDHEVVEAGLQSGSLALSLKQDYKDDGVDEVLFDIYNSSSGRARVEVRPASGSRSDSNPAYLGTWSLVSYDPVTARPGALRESPVQFRPYSKIARLTSG